MIRRLSIVSVLLIAFACATMAQDTASAKDSANNGIGTKNEKNRNSAKDIAGQSAVFSDAVASDVLGQIRDGLEGHSQRLMLSAFDSDRFDGYMTFEDQIDQYFQKFEGFRAHFRIIQTSTEGEKGVVLAEFDVESSPRSGGAAQRRSNQLRFEMQRGKKGWRVVDMRPRAFFS